MLGISVKRNFCAINLGCWIKLILFNFSSNDLLAETRGMYIERDQHAERGGIATICIDLLVGLAGEGFEATDSPVELSEDEDCMAFTIRFPEGEGVISLQRRWLAQGGVKRVEFLASGEGVRCVRCVVSGVHGIYRSFLTRRGVLSDGNRFPFSIKSALLIGVLIFLFFYFRK